MALVALLTFLLIDLSPGSVIDDLASLPKPLDLQSVYPEPKRQAAASRVSF